MNLKEFKTRFNIRKLSEIATSFFTSIPRLTANEQNHVELYQFQLRAWLKNFHAYLNRVTGSRSSLTSGLAILTVCQEAYQEAIQVLGVPSISFGALNFEIIFKQTNANIAQFDRREQIFASYRAAATSNTSTPVDPNAPIAAESSTVSNVPTTTVVQCTPAANSSLGRLSVFRWIMGNQIQHEPLNEAFELSFAKDAEPTQIATIKKLCNSRLKFINQLIAANSHSWDSIAAFLDKVSPDARIEFLATLPDNSMEILPHLAPLSTEYDHSPKATDANKLVIFAARLLARMLNRYEYYESFAPCDLEIAGANITLHHCPLVEEVVVRHMSLEGTRINVDRLAKLANDDSQWKEEVDTVLEHKRAFMKNLSAHLDDFDALLQDNAQPAQQSAASSSPAAANAPGIAEFSIFSQDVVSPKPLLELRYLKVLTQDADFLQSFTIHNLCNARLSVINRLIEVNRSSWERIIAFLNHLPPAARIEFLASIPADSATRPFFRQNIPTDYEHCPTANEDYKLVIVMARLLSRVLNQHEFYQPSAEDCVHFEDKESINLKSCNLVDEVVVRHMSLQGLRVNLRLLEQLGQNAREWKEDADTVLDHKPAFMKNIATKLSAFAALKKERGNEQQAQQVASTTTLFNAPHAGVKRSAPSHRDPSAYKDPKGQYPGM